jgi:hypothetical protein
MRPRANRRMTVSVVLALGTLVGAAAARADAPDGAYPLQFGGPQSIWVLEGASACEPGVGCFDLPVACDPRGSCAGTGSLFGLTGGLRAKLRGNDRTGLMRVTVGFRFEGVFAEGPLQGLAGRLTGTQKGQIDASGASSVQTKAKVCVPGLGCETVSVPGVYDVSPGEGDWELDLDVVDVDGSQLAGTAVATLSDDVAYDYTITGRYDARKDVSSLRLVPDAGSQGSSIRFKNVRVTGGVLQGEIQYKILGHAGKTLATSVQSLGSQTVGGFALQMLLFPLPPGDARGFSGVPRAARP